MSSPNRSRRIVVTTKLTSAGISKPGVRNILLVCLLWLVGAGLLQGQSTRSRADTSELLGFDSVLAMKYQRAIDSIRSLRGFNGVSAAVFLPDQGLWQGVSGVSFGNQTITPEMKFDIASNTKSFVSTTILLLAEERLLSLDDTLSRYLPPLPNITSSVTIRQLLNMTSGISNLNADAVEAAVFADPNKVWTPEESIAAFVGPPVGKPGGPWMYCNTNYILLGMVIKQITGSTISSQVRQRILTPLSLDSTYFGGEEMFSGPTAHPWYNGTDIFPIPRTANYTVALAAGGMVSTAADMARGVKALFEGALIAPSSLDQMRTCVPIPPGITFGGLDGLEMRGYGLGVFQAIADPRGMKIPIWGHGGHGWGYRSFMAYHPSLKAGCAAFINQSAGDPEELIAVLIEIMEQTMVAHAHNVSVAPLTPRKQVDTVQIRATVENPQRHTLSVAAFTKNFASENIQDSILLYNDGLHGDGLPDDALWGGSFLPTTAGVYGVSVRTIDGVAGTSREPSISSPSFATAGPVKYAGYRTWEHTVDTVPGPGVDLYVQIGLKNTGGNGLITNVTARIAAIDSLEDYASVHALTYGKLYPADTACFSTNLATLSVGYDRAVGDTASFAVSIYSNGVQFWRDTIRIVLEATGGVNEEKKGLPTSYALEQNYPNPFNPATTIRYSMPHRSHVTLTVFNPLGQQLATLVNREIEAGYHEIQFDALGLASGVYFYRLRAGDFAQTRKLLLLR
jgi:D-alanyl-D-alanine carboxypeptidase